jgi:four helix bundle protein
MEMHLFSFEKLEVWQIARKLAKDIYSVTRDFPKEERYELVQQMRRSALSICTNLAEGTTRLTPKDQARFSIIAFSSMMELLNHLIVSFDLGYIDEKKLTEFRERIQPLSVKIANLKRSQLSRLPKIQLIFLTIFSYAMVQPLQPLNTKFLNLFY